MNPPPGWTRRSGCACGNISGSWARDKIVLITTHITGDVESIASEILLLHHGVLLADAPAEEFIRGCGAANLEDAYIRRLHPHA